MDVIQFASELPKAARPHLLDDSRGVSLPQVLRDDYVAPLLLPTAGSDAAPATLVVAPAAAGKSTSAKALAITAQALFVDLARLRVADGSFLGLLSEALGDDEALHYRKLLRAGGATLVLDSLDESQLASGETQFVAFLRGICRFLRTSRGIGNVVMFARVDTGTWISTTFAGEHVPLRQLEIDYFDRESAVDFLDKKLDILYRDAKMAPVHRQFRKPFQVARDEVFSRVAEGAGAPPGDVWTSREVRRFLGYSPVLESIAAYLRVPDFGRLNSREALSVGGETPEWRILRSLTESLLERERKRFREGWLDDLSRPMFDNDEQVRTLYSAEEQCARLLHLVLTRQTGLQLPEGLPNEIRGGYQDAVDTQLRNHPFLSSDTDFVSSIFRDYASALLLSLHAPGESMAEVARDVLVEARREGGLATPALAAFVADMLAESGSAFASDRCDLLLASFLAQEDHTFSYRQRIELHEAAGILELARIPIGEDRPSRILHVALAEGKGGLRLPARCKDLAVDYDGDVTFASSGGSVKLGPDVHISAAAVIWGKESLHLDTTQGSVSIQSEFVASDYEQDIRQHGDAFVLIADEVEGPLRGYLSRALDRSDVVTLRDDFYALRRVLRFFRSTQHTAPGELAADPEQLSRYVLRTDARAMRLLQGLTRQGLVRSDGNGYYLDVRRLSSMEVSFPDIVAYHASPGVLALLRALSSAS